MIQGRWLWPTLILLSALGALLTSFVFPETPLRPFVVMWFLFVCPGMAIVRLLRLHEPMVEWSLAIALSFALDAFVAGAFLYAGRWSPTAILFVLIGLSVLVALFDVVSSTILAARTRNQEVSLSRYDV